MVEKFKKILEKIKKERGHVTLFALLRMDELTNKWTIIISAPWAKEGDKEIFKYLLSVIKEELQKDELGTIARLGIFPRDHHFIQLLLEQQPDKVMQNEQINGNLVHEGYIVEQNKLTERGGEKSYDM